MKRRTAIILLVSMLIILAVPSFAAAGDQASHQELAIHYSPVWYQDVANLMEDAICRFDYDGDWIGNNNWENLDACWSRGEVRGYVYTSVIETSTHYFITYTDSHARDWWNLNSDLWSHENDMEGVQVVVKKDGSYYGQFLLMETEAHNQLYQYTNDPTVTNGHENIDGGVLLYDGSHPEVYVESKGHGVYRYDGSDFPGGDGIIYHYGIPEQPSNPYDTNVGYGLVFIQDSLWPMRFEVGDGLTYGAWYEGFWNGSSHSEKYGAAFDGDTYGDDQAKPPWGWDDPDDGDVLTGDWFLNPAYTMSYHLNIAGPWSTEYTYNPFINDYGPVITSITPATGVQNSVIDITNLAGRGFQAGATVRIQGATTTVNATDVNVVSSTQITCKLNLAGAPLGKYDVMVRNPDGQEVKLTQGFSVTDACGGGATLALSIFGIMMGLMSLVGSAGRRRSFRGKRRR